MKLSEELTWRGFVNQTTFKNVGAIDSDPITFYWGVDPSADSMTIGNLAAAMMVLHFMNYGHNAFLLIGGATGMIGDPDGKKNERELLTKEEINNNKQKLAEQYKSIFSNKDFVVVDNYDWFQSIGYLDFLRDIGKHVPLRQMLGRDFVQSRLGEDGTGISYAEFSYSLIQAYDFLHLNQEYKVSLQLCGADQWGNSIAGVDLIRRVTGEEANVWSSPLIIDKATGIKFGKSESGAIWLDPAKTTPTQFYQFWINCSDESVEDYLKIYTLLSKDEIETVIQEHSKDPGLRLAQKSLAKAVTSLVHGEQKMNSAQTVTDFLTGRRLIGQATEDELDLLRAEVKSVKTGANEPIIDIMASGGLISSKSEGRRLIISGGVYINGLVFKEDTLDNKYYEQGRLLIRRGKRFEDTILAELG
jgi:tyrosyl-tRNA synthetase